MRYNRHNFYGLIFSIVILTTLLLLTNTVYAKYQTFTWSKRAGGTYYDYGYDITTDRYGNSIVTGRFSRLATFGDVSLNSAGGEEIFITKYDKSGNVLWAKQAGGTHDDNGRGIAVDGSGNIIVTGFFSGVATFGTTTLTSAGNHDIFLAKYDPSGNLTWIYQAGGAGEDNGLDVTLDESNNILVTGEFSSTATFGSVSLTSIGRQDIFIAKLDASGALKWVKRAGGVESDGAVAISTDRSGNCFITGSFKGIAFFDNLILIGEGWQSLFVAKYDISGNVAWVEKATSTGSVLGTDIAVDRSGNSIVTGWYYGLADFGATNLTSANRDMFIAKYNASGNILWVKQAGGASDDMGRGIVTDNSGNSYVTGSFSNQANFGNIAITSFGNSDIFITKYNPAGNVLWVKNAGGAYGDGGFGIDIDDSDNIIITGSFNLTAYFGTTSLTSAGESDIFVAKLKELPIFADFTANPTEGVAPLTVQFTDLSQGEITSWYWEFGDGDNSREQNPVHIYDPREDPKYTVSLTVTGPGGSDTETKTDYISVYLPVNADFDADRTVGPAPLEVNFKNLTTGSADTYEWSFGDGVYSPDFEPTHEYSDPGTYHVYLKATGPGGKDCKHRDGFITVYADSGYLCLKFVEGSPVWWEEPWDNASDGDTWGWDGTATVEGDTAFAIFEFKNQQIKNIDRFRLMSNTGVWFKDRWVKTFRVQVSTTTTAPTDFVTVLDTVKQDGEWEYFKIDPVDAKYVKLIIDEPASGWRQVGEFEVWEHIVLPDPMLSIIVATSPHYSTGIDPSTITLTLFDETGEPITGKAENIKMNATGTDNNFSEVTETADPGVYTATLSTTTPEVKMIWAKVQGVTIRYSNPADSTLCTVEFTELPLVLSSLELVEYSKDYPGEEWENAIDGDINGWDGTVTATGYPPYAIFKFHDDGIHSIHKIRMITDTGVRYSNRWVKRFRVLVSTSGINYSDFKLILDGHQITGDWQDYYFAMTDAKYIKLVIDEPNTTWRQLGEFEVYELESPLPIFAKDFIKTTNAAQSILSPDRFALLQNYPNPFNPETTIRYDLAEGAKVTVVIYNIRGQAVRTLVNSTEQAGRYLVNWDTTDDFGVQVTAGVYLYRIMAEYNGQVFSETKRMILLR